MKKELIISALSLLLIATPVFAAKPSSLPSNANSNATENHGQSTNNNGNVNSESHANVNSVKTSPTPTVATQEVIQDLEPSVSPSPTVAPEGDDEGSQDSTSDTQTCDPNANWKNHGAYVSCVAHLHLGGKTVSEAARSDIGKKHIIEDVSPTATPSPTTEPITSAESTITGGISPLDSIGSLFGKLLGFLKHLI